MIDMDTLMREVTKNLRLKTSNRVAGVDEIFTIAKEAAVRIQPIIAEEVGASFLNEHDQLRCLTQVLVLLTAEWLDRVAVNDASGSEFIAAFTDAVIDLAPSSWRES